MSISPDSVLRPPASADFRIRSPQLKVSLSLVVIGLGVAMVAFVSSIVQAARDGSDASIAIQAAWTFGVATAALGTIKTGIAAVLLGIVRRIWHRVESLKPESTEGGRRVSILKWPEGALLNLG